MHESQQNRAEQSHEQGTPIRVLYVEDDAKYRRLVMTQLRLDGYDAVAVPDGQSALDACTKRDPDLVILDLRLPDMDGIALITRMRQLTTTPIFVVSAVRSESALVAAMEAGADDYLAKPYSLVELQTRVRALVRRSQTMGVWGPELSYGNIHLSTRTRECTIGGRPVHLTPLEWRLLRELVSHGGELLSHEYLLGRVWGLDYRDEREYLRVYIRNLRQRIEPNPTRPVYLISVPGKGYALRMPGDASPLREVAEHGKLPD